MMMILEIILIGFIISAARVNQKANFNVSTVKQMKEETKKVTCLRRS